MSHRIQSSEGERLSYRDVGWGEGGGDRGGASVMWGRDGGCVEYCVGDRERGSQCIM